MRNLVYHVAMSLDNYICHTDGSIGGFAAFAEGEHVDEYMASLQEYDTVVMGRKTYEFGYDYGLPPGQPAYPHMMHYIFSTTLDFGDDVSEKVKVISADAAAFVAELKNSEGSDIYLCGGGDFAGQLLDAGLIDQLRIKLYPVILGDGIRLFGANHKAVDLKTVAKKFYDNGAMLLTYDVG